MNKKLAIATTILLAITFQQTIQAEELESGNQVAEDSLNAELAAANPESITKTWLELQRSGSQASQASQAAVTSGYTGNIIVETGSVSAVKDVGIRNFTKDASARAVHIKVTKTALASLIAGGIFGDNVTLEAEAVSLASTSSAAFSVGTTALTINTQDSVLLNDLLSEMLNTQTTINLDVIGYQGMANTSITLANLIKAEKNILSVDELLNLELNAGQWLSLISGAIRHTDTIDTDSPLLRVVNDVSHLANKAGNNTEINFSLGKIFNINPNSQAEALNAKLNVLNLVNMIARMAGDKKALGIPLEVNLPGLSTPTNAFWTSDAECIRAPQEKL